MSYPAQGMEAICERARLPRRQKLSHGLGICRRESRAAPGAGPRRAIITAQEGGALLDERHAPRRRVVIAAGVGRGAQQEADGRCHEVASRVRPEAHDVWVR